MAAVNDNNQFYTLCKDKRFNEATELLEKTNILWNEQNSRGLLQAAAAGQVELVELIIDRGAPLTATDSSGNTALHYAVDIRALEMIGSLCMALPSLAEAENNRKITPLKRAQQLNIDLHQYLKPSEMMFELEL